MTGYSADQLLVQVLRLFGGDLTRENVLVSVRRLPESFESVVGWDVDHLNRLDWA